MKGDWRINPGLKTPESWWAIVGSNMKTRKYLDDLNKRLKVPNSYKRMSEVVYDFREKYFKKYEKLDFDSKVNTLYEFLEKCKPSKDLDYAISICCLASHNILGSDILKWSHFIKDYSEIIPSEDEKKLNGNEIQKILKDRKIKLIEQELKKELD